MKILVANMETAIRKEMPNARLDLFGSAVNGCGAFNCDLNICFRFKEDIQPKVVSLPTLYLQLITFRTTTQNQFCEKLNIYLLQNIRKSSRPYSCPSTGLSQLSSLSCTKLWESEFSSTFFVYFSSTQIVAYSITYYNDIGLKSTALFRKYCEWEPHRFPQLILVVKRWAKDCNINSSKNGTLSSSALSLMLVHFLQQCSPPVLPPWDLNRVIIPQRYDFAKMPVIVSLLRFLCFIHILRKIGPKIRNRQEGSSLASWTIIPDSTSVTQASFSRLSGFSSSPFFGKIFHGSWIWMMESRFPWPLRIPTCQNSIRDIV